LLADFYSSDTRFLNLGKHTDEELLKIKFLGGHVDLGEGKQQKDRITT
jgi:hypothetical protein